MRRRGTPVSREALYEEVWTDAVTVVAPRYGLSDVGLVKICKKLGIPVPPRGYWAKLKAGRVATWVTERAIQILGGYGYTREYPMERWHRDAKIHDIFEGTEQIQQLVISRAISGMRIE